MAGSTKYKNNWQKEHVDRINLTVPKGLKETIQNHAAIRGESVNGFIKRAITETVARDPKADEREQWITQATRKYDCSVGAAERTFEVLEALSILQPDIPNIRELYFSSRKERQQPPGKPQGEWIGIPHENN